MKYKLLVNSKEFLTFLLKDMISSKDRIFMQMMTCEGDKSTLELRKAFINSKAKEKKLLVDSFTKYMLSDKFLLSPFSLLNKDIQKEKKETKLMFQEFEKNLIKVKWTNPIGFLLRKFPARNHKKIYVCDNISYIGGINFSEHNLAWHDMMIRIEDKDVADFLSSDIKDTWDKGSIYKENKIKDINLILTDGKNNEQAFNQIISLIKKAKKSIVCLSPYISFPVIDYLKEMSNKGVKVQIITPLKNNRETVKKYLIGESIHSQMELLWYKKNMMHLKAMLIDDKVLICGSSNFDYISYKTEEELLAFIKNEELIKDFKVRVVERDLKECIKIKENLSYKKALKYKQKIKLLADFAIFISK